MTNNFFVKYKTTPFQKLIKNIDKVRFLCYDNITYQSGKKYEDEYRRALLNVLNRLDDYFMKNDLYKCRDYNYIVKNILDHLTFKPLGFHIYNAGMEEDIDNNAGIYYRFHNINNIANAIYMNPQYMFKGTTTEGVLCHEFFHYLTHVPTPTENPEFSKMQIDKKTSKTYESIASGFTLFLNEGMTELAKQQIYNSKECYKSYLAETTMVSLLKDLIDERNFIREYLTTNLDYYVQYFGAENFEKFKTSCNNTFQKRKKIWNNFEKDPDYLDALDTLVHVVLDKLANKDDILVRELCEKCGIIFANKPWNRYNDDIQKVIETQAERKFGNDQESKTIFIKLASQTKDLYYKKIWGIAEFEDVDLKIFKSNEKLWLSKDGIISQLDICVDKDKDVICSDETVRHYSRLDEKIVRVTITDKDKKVINSYTYDQDLLKKQNIVKVKILDNPNEEKEYTTDLNELEKRFNARIEENLIKMDKLEQDSRIEKEKNGQPKIHLEVYKN